MSWIEEQYKGTQQTGSDGRIGGKGLGAFFWQQFVDEDKINKSSQKDLNTQTAIGLGEDINDLEGIDSSSSALDVKGAAIKRGRERTKTAGEEAHTKQLGLVSAQQATGQEQIKATERTSAAQIAAGDRRASENMTLLQQQMLNQSKESRLDRAERADQRADDRMMQMEMYERADRKDEKNRRRESIQALVAGLSSLGAAFAV
jgi:hypothetical protein